jgi:uncharacterized protein (TIGR03085 family)
MTESIDARERRELCDLLETLGPDAPTLCEGWTTADLAAHLVLREHFHRWTPARIAAEKRRPWPALLHRLRHGAPPVPWRLPGARTLLNGMEYFIHHEDVRRANGLGPRPADAGMRRLEELAWRMDRLLGMRAARRLRPHGLELVRPEGARQMLGAAPRARLSGAPSELLLYLSGRGQAAEVSVSGEPPALAALERASLRL